MLPGTPIDDLTDELVGVFGNPAILIGIPLAVLGAVFMSFGAQYQHRGVQKVERLTAQAGVSGLTGGQLLRLLRRPSWVLGTVMLGLAIVCQLAALSFAPLILVQPIGAISLVITTLLNARVSGHKPTRRSITSIALCVGGIFIFVTVAALYATERPISDPQLLTVLWILLGVVVVLGVLWVTLRKRMRALFYIVAAGIVYGFVATLAKVVINRISNGDFEWLTVLCIVALLAGTAMGAYFVQTAYSSGPPDLVIAGLTVIDPIVAIVIGLTVLQEASGAPVWAYIGFVFAGALAIVGVFQLARYHPQVISDSQEIPIARGSAEFTDGKRQTTGSIRLTETVSKVWPEPPVKDEERPKR
ncbi:DMT family transporter [Microbacterium sp. EYE_5]|uniref:DMT family transporter n=1 Tax=unclassified Microbacterium TaxID=2609290 RepID=UPI0020040DDB|nr:MULTISPECIES: DMT family transporter [unclassified Microbacterium]MCK6080631.1 DMT family transporter [Microbacterium sp. EYE_382]MCK6085902.1 DMT family transporter [Microbacterium sp. EYE_384]MCK6124600.1 DMT family transporter [Microbacterium sp. EYE_80]MCK6127509.1 DMT family transporter [Microbacterium sp. EYE_79]MCK6141586.1 DMT family transporter [Microbacterium sp. EYE_39]